MNKWFAGLLFSVVGGLILPGVVEAQHNPNIIAVPVEGTGWHLSHASITNALFGAIAMAEADLDQNIIDAEVFAGDLGFELIGVVYHGTTTRVDPFLAPPYSASASAKATMVFEIVELPGPDDF